MEKIPLFEKFNQNQSLVEETYAIMEGHMTYDEVNELIGEGIFSFIKGLFTNPVQKRKLDNLGDDLFKTKVELMKLEIEEEATSDFKAQLDTMTRGTKEYEVQDQKIQVADKAKGKKIEALRNKESVILDQMDLVAGDSEKLQKYVNKIKLEIRIKANDAAIRIADAETARILTQLKKADQKEVQSLDKELK